MTTKIELLPLYNDEDKERVVSVKHAHKFRSEFRRDYARLIHSPAFRRLQGKTQLFPGVESDFFRNRLTHSHEVAQIAKTIAAKFNVEEPYFSDHPIDTDLVEMAALAHDLGHPPFGHNGEYALNECMRYDGGFEGNAQTLRIVSKLEKREKDGDSCIGLNLTFRSLAAVLKYDKEIPVLQNEETGIGKTQPAELVKGYYASENDLIKKVKTAIRREESHEKFKTIECDIMDIADDIAYSTYDLEDALKAGFVTPLDILRHAYDEKFLVKFAEKVSKKGEFSIDSKEIQSILIESFGSIVIDAFNEFSGKLPEDPVETIRAVVHIYSGSRQLASDGHLRSILTSDLVNEFVSGVSVIVNQKNPALSKIHVEDKIKKKIEILKHFTYETLIMSPRLKIVEYRGREVVTAIFNALSDEKSGFLLLPDDCRHIFETAQTKTEKRRLVCDFIAGMTDRYAIEFYSRLASAGNGLSFFKPI